MARLVRGLFLTVIAFTLAFGALATHREDASAGWTGYWIWNTVTHSWVWTWFWSNVPQGWGIS